MENHAPELEWNELILVSRHRGQVDVWVGWKRAVAAFADPRVWESTDHWPDYFTRQEKNVGYGMGGYGLIVMDLDTKQGWSINDFSHPGSIHLPQDYELENDDEPRARAAFAQLLSRPDQWPYVEFEVAAPPGFTASLVKNAPAVTPATLPLSKMISADDSVEANERALVLKRGTLNLPAHPSLMVFSGKYTPDGWTVSTTLGRSDLEVLEECLTQLSALGFPPPAPSLVLPLVEEKAEEECDEMEEDVAPEDIVGRFEYLLEAWGSRPASPLRPR